MVWTILRLRRVTNCPRRYLSIPSSVRSSEGETLLVRLARGGRGRMGRVATSSLKSPHLGGRDGQSGLVRLCLVTYTQPCYTT